jgi:hypothetical protein
MMILTNGIVISDIARAYASSEFQTPAFIGDVIRDYALNTEQYIFLPSVLGYLERVKGLSSYGGGVREAAGHVHTVRQTTLQSVVSLPEVDSIRPGMWPNP